MRLTAFQSDKGDCLLLTNSAGTRRMLVDGGMSSSYTSHVAPELGRDPLDVVYISHIDRDHISGCLRLLDDEAAWRIHEFQKKSGNRHSKPPSAIRPPKVGEIWHNAFHEQLKENAGPVGDALAAVAPLLAGSDLARIREEALKQSDLVTSIAEAIQVSRRISPKQLNIPLNPRSGGKLMMLRRKQKPIRIGDLKITIIGPTAAQLEALRDEWNEWLRSADGKKRLKKLRDAARREEERLGLSEFDGLMASLRLKVESFGDPDDVTVPNVASLCLLVEDHEASVLLTGDARGDHLIEGLREKGLVKNGRFEVDVLKVQHHGSKNNVDSDFVRTVVARDYVFCGNGGHGNPHVQVVDMMFRHRLAVSNKPFHFWFNSSAAVSAERAHMAAVEAKVRKLVAKGKGRFKATFLEKGNSIQVL
jgi:beta-lactamase superfamily II metal-dependent hydrolase